MHQESRNPFEGINGDLFENRALDLGQTGVAARDKGLGLRRRVKLNDRPNCQQSGMNYRHPHSLLRRGLKSFVLVSSVVGFGTIGIHLIEGLSYVDSFYFMSMLATSQGPASVPVTVAGKLFAAIMAFVSVGSVVAALGFLFGPFFGKLWRIGVEFLEEEAHLLEKRIEKKEEKQSGK